MDAVLCMKISNGRIMTGSMDHSVRVWCNGSGRSMHKLYGHKGSVGAIDFNREWIVSGSWDMTVMVWDSENYEYRHTLYGHLDRVTSLQLTHFMLSVVCIERFFSSSKLNFNKLITWNSTLVKYASENCSPLFLAFFPFLLFIAKTRPRVKRIRKRRFLFGLLELMKYIKRRSQQHTHS